MKKNQKYEHFCFRSNYHALRADQNLYGQLIIVGIDAAALHPPLT